jgi:RNA polymerase sigma factor (sigma-70 family)
VGAVNRDEPAGAPATVDIDAWIGETAVALRRALVARYGLVDGSDAAAEAVAWAWEHHDRVAAMTNPAGYLFRVGQSSLRQRRRRERRRVDVLPCAVARDMPEADEELFTMLRRLTPDQRVAVVVVGMYGFTYRNVAEMLDISEAAVTNHVHRGLARLRRLLPERTNSNDRP